MLCRKFKQITLIPIPNNVTIRFIISTRQFSKKCINILTFARLQGASFNTMSSSLRLKNILNDLVVSRLFSAWTRSYTVSSVVKRCRKERTVRDAIQCFRQTIWKPKRTLLFTVTAAYKSQDEKPEKPGSCSKDITDEELQDLVSEFEGIEELAAATLYCMGCAKRVKIDNDHPGVRYCTCKNVEPPQATHEGWEPYMEAEDVIIWRKEYKKGKGLYAYKVYGRYKEIRAQDFAAIQVDGAYRRVWDTAVAALSVVEKQANGIPDQIVLHWEVLWPRLFANRDYVYVRRHKEFNIKARCFTHKEGIFSETPCQDTPTEITEKPVPQTVTEKPVTEKPVTEKPVTQKPVTEKPITERPSVHSNAKRKTLEQERKEKAALEAKRKTLEKENKEKTTVEAKRKTLQLEKTEKAISDTEPESLEDNKAYIIVSRSCVHPHVPETKNAIRVMEYWSHMVVKTLDGPDKPGMEFVLTYYDEPAVGGMPSAVTSWATGRAAPAFITRMRKAATDYVRWRARNDQQEPDFTPFGPEKVSFHDHEAVFRMDEQDMESSKLGPDLESVTREQGTQTREQGTQTEVPPSPSPSLAAPAVLFKIAFPKQNNAGTDEGSSISDTGNNIAVTKEEVTQISATPSVPMSTKETEMSEKPSEKSAQRPEDKCEDKSDDKSGDKSEGQSDETPPDEETTRWWRYLHPYYYFV